MSGIEIFNFLAFCLDRDKPMPIFLDAMDWKLMYQFARQQAIVGVVSDGILRLDAGLVKIQKEELKPFLSTASQIKRRNFLLYQQSAKVGEQLSKDGFKNCILKGQGNALMYADPYIRTAGDVDVWVSGGRRQVMDYVKQRQADVEVRYYHAEYTQNGVPVEVHFMPGIMNNPLYNSRIQHYYQTQFDRQCANSVSLPDGIGIISIPTAEFNVVFQLAHMMHHFFDEGIGLRQMIDYYYVLKSLPASHDDYDSLFRRLGLRKFAGAVMFVMNKVLGLDDKYLIVPMDERRGKTLLREILRGGNFGKHSGLTKHSAGEKYFLKHWRSLHFVREYPAEALCEPFFRTWHFFWRLAHR